MTTVYLNIGSNQGDRHALIERAVALIVDHTGPLSWRRSAYIESEPWGFDSPHRFVNLGLALDYERLDDELVYLAELQRIERRVGELPHRGADGTYRDRDIDIDIIAIDRRRIDLPGLVVPHPRAAARDFVMVPLRQLAPPDVVDFVAGNDCDDNTD